MHPVIAHRQMWISRRSHLHFLLCAAYSGKIYLMKVFFLVKEE